MSEATEFHCEDADDVAASLTGDQDAFGRIVGRHQETITAQMRRFSRDRAVQEELVHDVFVEAYFSLKSYREKSPLLYWLRKIAIRVGYRHWKREKRRPPIVSLSEIGEELLKLAAEDVLSPSESGDLLEGLLDHLRPRDRLVLTLLYRDGCSVEEAAERSGWSRSMVKVQAFRARQRLRRLLEQAGYGEEQ